MIKIKVIGNSVFISDDGTGMGMEKLVEARKFGVSAKCLDGNAGFRGIGIYEVLKGFVTLTVRQLAVSNQSPGRSNSLFLDGCSGQAP